MKHVLANTLDTSKGNGSTATLLFLLKRVENLYQEGSGQVKALVM
jgi:hypothetical protein